MADTIYALATSQGRAGVAVVRISGPEAFTSLKSLCINFNISPRKSKLCDLYTDEGLHLDRALVIPFKGPQSFTGEDVVELHLHGSIAVIQKTLETLSKLPNLRQALPGEFTRRAFTNEKLDLAEIEGLADLIEAETEAQRVQALQVLSGKLGQRVQEWRSMIIKAMAFIEVTIDFADEEVPTDISKDVLLILTNIIKDLEYESESTKVAERIRSGFEVAIVGKPNVGKSSLLNALSGREAALTSEEAGTTRDIIEVRMDLGGLPVTMMDTAGLRDTDNLIENKGISKAIEKANSADLVIVLTEDGEIPIEIQNSSVLKFVSKCDDGELADGVSAFTGYGLDNMISSIKRKLEKRVQNQGLATRYRHREAIDSAVNKIQMAKKFVKDGPSFYDLAAEELRQTTYTLDELFGKVDVENVLDEIFSSFCLGK
ncbi:tRNA uridine-5-carboxymethylaminomethyl(34) synthesis GTPase MnmE [Paracoccaceae bacterium]|jgi:tRNA modification GTPase|nr:tRNA uridine-5-carboxymethylaminomethyl(34) synthesis GTPase MnmE [Paracoccaceae bacterium]MDG0987696.1 tRNA uridine-5-carboxymethylaminomethyl(34) synthesis GTPase MnmE [Paracoccaceae bacterium]MDG1676715.1 tRNA uridine-5-carboxymethylaminomethyl(34) synthesis GTPase MnmE [Paracoccaceae bacterium]MDG2249165.1 tRNA uridine-5-carboxymethylaminomethyl(34) synthesis GTPase MnmE [Paracoccaceae bacterium]|tara:strand:+ start:1307 stop:2596 length:1290 start_codon:yes stop_codon:yes gene_type:complete